MAPATTDPSYDKWEIENFIIMAWLINSMKPEIGEGFYWMKTAHDIWDTVAPTFSRKGIQHKRLNYSDLLTVLSRVIGLLPSTSHSFLLVGIG